MSYLEDILRNVGAAGSGAVITVTGIHPIDVVKTRLQVSGKNGARNYKALGIFGTVGIVAKEEGVTAFWKGIQPAWMREASYTALRMGLYGPIKDAMKIDNNSSFFMKFAAGSLAGAIGSTAGNPFDVLKTRMMASEGSVTLVTTASALFKGQGIAGFYRGLEANVMRAMVLNGTSMAVYDQCTDLIKKSGIIPAGVATQFCASFTAGFFMAITVSPFDMVRTRLMNQPPDAKLYSGFVDCVIKVMKESGPMGFYQGFVPIWARFAPTTCLQFIFYEQLKPVFGLKK